MLLRILSKHSSLLNQWRCQSYSIIPSKHDPFRLMPIDQLIKLSSSKQYQIQTDIQFYITFLNSIILRKTDIQLNRSIIITQQIQMIIKSSLDSLHKINSIENFLSFANIVFEGIAKRAFVCDRFLLLQFVEKFKFRFIQILQNDRAGQYYDEVKHITIQLITLRKGSYLLNDILKYFTMHANNEQKILEFVDTLEIFNYKTTNNLSKAVQTFFYNSIVSKINQLDTQHLLLDQSILKLYYRFRLNMKRPSFDVAQWMFYYISLLKKKYMDEQYHFSVLKKISFGKNYLKILMEISASSHKRQIIGEDFEKIQNFIDDIFNLVNSIDSQDILIKADEFCMLLSVYREFLIKNSFIYINPFAKNFHEMMNQLYQNIIKYYNMANPSRNILYLKLIIRYVKLYHLFSTSKQITDTNTNFAYYFDGFSQSRDKLTLQLIETVFKNFVEFEKNNCDNWQSFILLEPLAQLIRLKYDDGKNRRVVEEIKQRILKIARSKIETLAFDLVNFTKYLLFVKYLKVPLTEIEKETIKKAITKNTDLFFQNYAESIIKNNDIIHDLESLTEKQLLSIFDQGSLNILLCSLKPVDNKIDHNIYDFWFNQKQHLIAQVINSSKYWSLLNVAFRFQFVKINNTSIDLIYQFFRLGHSKSEGQIVFSKIVRNELNKIFRDEIMKNLMINKVDSIAQYKYIFVLSKLGQWNIFHTNHLNQKQQQNYVSFRTIIDLLYLSLFSWDNPLRKNTLKSNMLKFLLNKIITKCYENSDQSTISFKETTIQKILYWLSEFGFLNEIECLQQIEMEKMFPYLRSRLSRIHCWELLLSVGKILKNNNTQKQQKYLLSLQKQNPSESYKNSAAKDLSLIKICNFIRGNEEALQTISDYELTMIFLHKEIMLSGADNCLFLAIQRFLASDITLTYKQFSTLVNSLTILKNKKRIISSNLQSQINHYIKKKFCLFSENLMYNYLIDYFCLSEEYGQISKIEPFVTQNLNIALTKYNLDVIQFMYKRQQIVDGQLYSEFLSAIKIRNLMGEVFCLEATLFITEVLFIYLYASVIFQRDHLLLDTFYREIYLQGINNRQFMQYLWKLPEDYRQKLFLRQSILKSKLSSLNQYPLMDELMKINPQSHEQLLKSIQAMVIQKLTVKGDKSRLKMGQKGIQISISGMQELKTHLNSPNKQIKWSTQQELMAIYLEGAIQGNWKPSLSPQS